MITHQTARRYTSPSTPPKLTSRVAEVGAAPPQLCLRCGPSAPAAHSLVTFAWSGLGSVRSRR